MIIVWAFLVLFSVGIAIVALLTWLLPFWPFRERP